MKLKDKYLTINRFEKFEDWILNRTLLIVILLGICVIMLGKIVLFGVGE